MSKPINIVYQGRHRKETWEPYQYHRVIRVKGVLVAETSRSGKSRWTRARTSEAAAIFKQSTETLLLRTNDAVAVYGLDGEQDFVTGATFISHLPDGEYLVHYKDKRITVQAVRSINLHQDVTRTEDEVNERTRQWVSICVD